MQPRTTELRVTMARDVLYSESDALRYPPDGGGCNAADIGAMRLAVFVMVMGYKLVWYPSKPEISKVSS